jgi:hypothetical protein
VVGTGVNQASANTAYLVHKNTAFGGRTGRGRCYIPGVVEASVGPDGDLLDATQTAITTDFQAWRTEIIALDLVPVVLHGPGHGALAPRPITSFACDGFAATQRRRMRR